MAQPRFVTDDFATKFLKTFFAQNGQFEELKDDNPGDDTLNLADGYGNKYEEDPLQNGEYIKRLGFNGIMARLSKEIRYWQVFNNREYDSAINSLGGYPKGAKCSVWYNISTGRLNSAGKSDPLCILMPVVSMKDNNQTNPYSSGALNTDWFIDDGKRIGEIYISDVNLNTPPDGYLDIGSTTAQQIFNKDDYPRVKALLDANGGNWGYFKNYSLDPVNQFELINRRGYFHRVWSNGSSIDSARQFQTLQNDAIRNITGGWRGESGLGSQWNTPTYAWRQSSTNSSQQQLYDGCFSARTEEILAYDLYTSSAVLRSAGWKMDTSIQVPTANENRPYNGNEKRYVKI